MSTTWRTAGVLKLVLTIHKSRSLPVAKNNDQQIRITGVDFDELIASLKDAGVPGYESNWRELRFVLSKYL
ncbi:hypothetical protein ACLEDP_06595 [Lonsdalea quercina]|uniref:hypothetical protein n=1 Tax=Lonsdalea quercina TaxID=71657 RepID=UPI0039769811